MTRRVKQSRSLLTPLAESFISKLSSTNARLRRKVFRYGMWMITAAVVYSFMSGTFGIRRIVSLELEKTALANENRELVAKLIDAERKKKLLKYDPDYIEYIARTKYYMVYPKETIYRYSGR